jgi:type IV secretory pathway protease TraF
LCDLEKENARLTAGDHKRIAARAGERLVLLHCNDRLGDGLLDLTAAAHLRHLRRAGRRPEALVISLRAPPDHCFVLSDNSSASVDSREFGAVLIRPLLGRIVR